MNFDGWTVQWMKNWLRDHNQRSTAQHSDGERKQVMFPRGLYWDQYCYSIFISDIDSGIGCILSKFADDTKLNAIVDTLEAWYAIQRDLDKLEKWAHVNLTRFNKAKCKVLHLGQGNSQYQYRLRDERIESSPEKKDLGGIDR
ncbi:hypothetical protein GRJ2_001020900 [Grus japonensis]|uniref:Rna-directed dna polymerase from mobile element jockey-like n=1 Tax=Grus japonensis TaxID=30415 RepID=A0ABC9WJZ1_GRUJA